MLVNLGNDGTDKNLSYRTMVTDRLGKLGQTRVLLCAFLLDVDDGTEMVTICRPAMQIHEGYRRPREVHAHALEALQTDTKSESERGKESPSVLKCYSGMKGCTRQRKRK